MPINVQIVLKAVDRVTGQLNKASGGFKQMEGRVKSVEASSRRMGSTMNSTMNRVTATTNKTSGSFKALSSAVESTGQSTARMGASATTSLGRISSASNETSRSVKTIGSSFDTVKTAAGNTTTTTVSGFSRIQTIATTTFNRVKSAANNAFTSMKAGVASISEAFDGLNGAISGVIAGFGLMEMASTSMGGAMKRELMTSWLTMKAGKKTAEDYARTIADINRISPAPSGFLNQLLTGAIARNTKISTGELRSLAAAASDYFMASQMMGKSAIETQMDLIEYINTGNTSQLERDSIIKSQIDKLKNQQTIEGRILALNQALQAEGYKGISQQDAALIKWETLKGNIEETLIQIGSRMLPVVKDIVSAFNAIDEKTGGWASKITVATGAFIGLGGVLGLAGSALKPFFSLPGKLAEAAVEGSTLQRVFAVLSAPKTAILNFLGSLKSSIQGVTAAQATSNAVTGQGIILRLREGAAAAILAVKNTLAAGATGILTAAQAALNAVMAINPIFLVIMAVTALIAVLYILYQRYESVRAAVDSVLKPFKDLGAYIMGVLNGALKDAASWLSWLGGVISSNLKPGLDWLAGGLKWVWDGLSGLLKPLIDVVTAFYTTDKGVRSLISSFGPLGAYISMLLNPLGTLKFMFQQLKAAWDQWTNSAEGKKTLGELAAAFNQLKAALGSVWAALQPVFQALGDVFNEIKNAISPVDSASKSMEKLSGKTKDAGSSASDSQSPLQIFVDVIRAVGWILQNIVIPAIRLFVGIIRILAPVISAVAQVLAFIIGVVAKGIVLFIQFAGAVGSVVSQFMGFVGKVLGGVASIIGGFISFPFQVLSCLYQVITGGMSWSEALKKLGGNAAVKFVTAILSFLMSLPAKFIARVMGVIHKLPYFVNRLREQARQAAKNFVDKLINGILGLPGKVSDVMWDVVDAIKNKINDAYNAAKDFGKNVWNGIKSALHIKSPSIIYKQIAGDLALVDKEFRKMGDVTGSSARAYAESLTAGTSRFQAPTIQAPSITPMEPVTASMEGVSTAIHGLEARTGEGINNVLGEWRKLNKSGDLAKEAYKKNVDVTKDGMTRVVGSVRTGMKTVVDKTSDGVKSVTKGFKDMSTKVVSEAAKSKSGVTSHINTLSTNIKKFYRLVMNPGGAGGPAGAPGIPSRLRVSAPMGLGAGPVPRPLQPGPALTLPDPYTMRGAARMQRIAEEFYRMLQCPECSAGAWGYSSKWTPWINKTIDKWKVSFLPGLKLKAGDFTSYPPKGIAGSLSAFIPFISAVIGRTRYAFYYGSSGRSVAQLLKAGAFNCYDGARVVVGLARAFGLPGSVQCGLSWNGIPHCAARVAGMWFDTTAFQHGYGWTSPKVTGYGGPGIDLKPPTPVVIESSAGGDVNLNVEVHAAPGMDEEKLAARIVETITDHKTIKRLTSSPIFLRRFDEEYGRYATNEGRRTGT